MKKTFVLLGLLLGALLFAGCTNQGTGNNASATPIPTLTSGLTVSEQELAKYPDLSEFIKAYQRIGEPAKRPDYLPSIVFSKLPPFPRDFYSVRLLLRYGKFTDFNKFGPEYWKQPEFYPNWEAQGVPLYQHPETGRWGAFGVGSYPSEIVVETPKTGTFEVPFYMFTSWSIQTYQGMSFTYGFPKSSFAEFAQYADNSKNVTQDPDVVKNYFDVEITPKEMLLPPNFPIFEQDWSQRVAVKVRVKNPPSGHYVIGIGTAPPSRASADKWLWQYRERYTDATSTMADIGRPWFRIFIDV